jgi:hypothetical protein
MIRLATAFRSPSEMPCAFMPVRKEDARNGLCFQCIGNISGFLEVAVRLHKPYVGASSVEWPSSVIFWNTLAGIWRPVQRREAEASIPINQR